GVFSNNQRTGITSYEMYSGSGIQLSSIVPPSSANGFTGNFRATVVNASNPAQMWFAFRTTTPTSTTNPPGFTAASTFTSIQNGFYTLEFQCCGAGFVKSGGTYVEDVVFPGDWSLIGTGPGRAQLLTQPASGWTITQNFAYDPFTNTTLF